ncbi:MAG: hypothetical protein HQL06_08870 [Nitrospirae bacterium]|nr:hypothetical protein [Nitrospirota bacterium]
MIASIKKLSDEDNTTILYNKEEKSLMKQEKISTEVFVMRTLIESYPSIKNYQIMTANPDHQLSGLSILRILKVKGLISYTFDKKTNTYTIQTPYPELQANYEKLKNKKRKSKQSTTQ